VLKTKVDKETVESLKYQVMDLSTSIEENNKQISQINSDVNEIKETVKIIEPSYVQNIDLNDLRTYINIFNFRLILNFFIAVSLSLLAIEGIKFFGDFFSYAKSTNNWDVKNYLEYRRINKFHLC